MAASSVIYGIWQGPIGAVWSALNEFIHAPEVQTANGAHQADLADALIVAKAKALMAQWCQPYNTTFTFDWAAQALAGTRAP